MWCGVVWCGVVVNVKTVNTDGRVIIIIIITRSLTASENAERDSEPAHDTAVSHILRSGDKSIAMYK